MIKSPKLQDAVAMNALHPYSFELPSKTQISLLQSGDMVQVCADGERFWIKLLYTISNDHIGIVDNDLVNTDTHGLILGDLISFETHNIYKVMPDEIREKLPLFLICPDEDSKELYILRTKPPRFVGKIISDGEKKIKIRDVMIFDEPINYSKEMAVYLKEMADWFYYSQIKK